jgi:hypothetical protein
MPLCFVSADAVTYSGELLFTAKHGEKDGEIAFRKGMIGYWPSYIYIADNNSIYLCDFENRRANVYNDRGFYYDILLDENCRIQQSPSEIVVDISENIYASYSGEFLKLDNEGIEVYYILTNILSKRFNSSKQFWLYGEYVLFYSDAGERKAIDPEGNILGENEILDLINEAKAGGELYPVYKKQIDEFLEENRLMMIDDRLLSLDFDEYCEFWSLFGNTGIFEKFDRHVYFGHDKNNNSYWTGKLKNEGEHYWFCYSPTGDLLDKFTIDMRVYSIVLAPNGDLYTMINNKREQQFEFYRFERNFLE